MQKSGTMKVLMKTFVLSARQPLFKRLNSNLAFVPTHQSPEESQVEALRQLLEGKNNTF